MSHPVLSALQSEVAALLKFVDVLYQEQTALRAGGLETLNSLVEIKTVLGNQLSEHSRQRDDALTALGLPTGKTGMERFIDQSGSPLIKSEWAELLARAAEARELNQLNGKLIGLLMQHNQSALSALTAASDRVMTYYGSDGQQRTDLSHRKLGSA